MNPMMNQMGQMNPNMNHPNMNPNQMMPNPQNAHMGMNPQMMNQGQSSMMNPMMNPQTQQMGQNTQMNAMQGVGVGAQQQQQQPQQDAERNRFIAELEFVQCLANPNYICFLAQHGYFKKPEFINYIKYLEVCFL